MADEHDSGADRSEEATPERREEFREQGNIALSREVTSGFVLLATVVYLTYAAGPLVKNLMRFLEISFSRVGRRQMSAETVGRYLEEVWIQGLSLCGPPAAVTAIAAVVATLAQTQLSFSWKKITPDFTRLGLRSGLGRILNTQSLFEAVKGTGKMLVVGLLTYSILAGEWKKVPGMMYIHVSRVWSYWGHVTQRLAWSVVAFAVALGVLDYLVNFLSLERKLRMTKEEVKEEYKKREFDPHLKARIRRMQREIASAKTIRATKTATVVITNPTHYAVALKYKRGLRAPVVVAKGVDSVALKMREIAKENQIPVVENPPLARTLYKVIEVGREIPETLWTAVSEIIKYVIRVKGWQFLQQQDEVS